MVDDTDTMFLRRAFAIAQAARAAGNRPFGAVIVDASGAIVVEAGSTQTTDNDLTAHAEMNAVRRAFLASARARLATATIYASSEPCVMCAAAIFYAGVGRIVFGFPEARLRLLRNVNQQAEGLALSCRDVLVRSSRSTEVVGPVLEDEAAEAHHGFWSAQTR